MKRTACLILILISSFAAGQVHTYIEFAQDIYPGWLTTVDIDDLRAFAPNWLNYDPNATEGSTSTTTHTLTYIDLEGSFCDQYLINSLPVTGSLYNYYSSRPGTLRLSRAASHGANWTKINSVPYQVKKGGSTVLYYTESTSNDGFTFLVKNSSDGRTSEPEAISITPAAYTKDSLCFERAGSVTIADPNSLLNFDDSFSFCCWIRPQARFGTILQKRGASGAGFKLSISAKHIMVEAWNTAGQYGRVTCEYDLDLDTWYPLIITKGHADSDNDQIFFAGSGYSVSGLPAPPYSNGSSVIVGSKFVGQIDKLTWFDAKSDFEIACWSIEPRTGYNGVFTPTGYLAQFRCDEGTGSTITDYVSGTLTGALTSVAWEPDNRPRRRKYNFN